MKKEMRHSESTRVREGSCFFFGFLCICARNLVGKSKQNVKFLEIILHSPSTFLNNFTFSEFVLLENVIFWVFNFFFVFFFVGFSS